MTYQVLTSKEVEFLPKKLVAFFKEMIQPFTWQEADYQEALKNPQQLFIAIFVEKKLVGLAHVSFLFESGEILNIGVKKECQKQGIGQRLLEECINTLREIQVENLLLEVRASNLSARSLYEKSGFQQIAVRKEYYHQPIEDAIIYQKYLA